LRHEEEWKGTASTEMTILSKKLMKQHFPVDNSKTFFPMVWGILLL